MDPSEFEDVVEKSENVLNAGALEALLSNIPEYRPPDLQKECGDVYLNIFNVNEALVKWNEVSLIQQHQIWDESMIKITQIKEEYLARRKVLAREIKSVTEIIDENSSDSQAHVKQLIDNFKAEYDFLANGYKFTENLFVTTYKLLRDAPDPVVSLSLARDSSQKLQEVLKECQNQFKNASIIIERSSTKDSSVNIEKVHALQEEYERLKEDLSIQTQLQVKELQSRHDQELKAREESLKESLERKHEDIQNQLQRSLDNKDSQLSDFILSISELKSKIMFSEEKEKLFESEVQKRRESEEKFRVAMNELSMALEKNREQQLQIESLSQMDVHKREELVELQNQLHMSIETGKNLKSENESMRLEIQNRPSIDWLSLKIKLGITDEDNTNINDEDSSIASLSPNTSPSWSQIESYLIDIVRKYQSLAAKARVERDDYFHHLNDKEMECQQLSKTLQEKNVLIGCLEEEIQRCRESNHPTSSKPSHQSLWTSPSKIANNNNKNNNNSSNDNNSNSSHSSHLSHENSNDQADQELESIISADVVVDSTGLSSAAQLSSSDQLQQALVNQRQRLMTMVSSKDQENYRLQQSCEKWKRDFDELQKENLELYNRLRSLRALSRGGPSPRNSRQVGHVDDEESMVASNDKFHNNNYEDNNNNNVHTIHRNTHHQLAVVSDSLEMKYNKFYENSWDSYQSSTISSNIHDRENPLSPWAFLLKWDGYLLESLRFLLRDSMTRKAILLYLIFVHWLAFAYTFQVLNPLLQEEIDAYNNAKFSDQTLEFDMLREHPDA